MDESHCGNLEALSLLGDVLSVLTEPSNKVYDDTCIEKLLSWLTKVASKSVTLKKLFHEGADVIGFLKKTSTHTDPSTCNQLCDAPGLTFALRLAAILLNSLHLQLGIKSGTSSDEAVCMEGCDDETEEDTWKHYVDVISDSTEQLLIGAHQLSYWEQGSVRMAYFVATKALIYHRCPSNVCQQADILNTAFAALEDNSMFVVTAAQQFLAALIATSHSCVKRESTRDSLTGSSVLQGTPSTSREDGFTNSFLKGTNKLCTEETSVTQKSALCATLMSDCQVKRPLCTSDSFSLKKSKGNHQEESSNKWKNCDCEIYLKTLLQKLTEMLQIMKSIAPNAVDLRRHCKLWSVCVGVVRSLIETFPEKGQWILSDMSLISVISELLNSQCHIHPNMCHSIVDFVSMAAHIYILDSDTDMENSSLRIMINFPWQLLTIHQFNSSIQLASILHRALQHSKVNGNEWFERLRLMDLVMLPLHCVLNNSKPSDCKLSPGRHALHKEMFSSKCQCVTILTHSLCALDNMLLQCQSQVMSKQSSFVDDGISILSVTLGQESQQTAMDSLKGHLRGSLKVTKVILALLMNIVDSENKSEFKLTEVCLMRLIVELTTILNNPESDCTVICKCLDSLASLLSIHTLILKDKIDCMRLLGELMIKKSWDPQWEVRDSVIGFLKTVLKTEADSLLAWFKLYNLHLRIFECINDGDNFVRASALAAMVDVSKKQDLWQDLLTQTGKSELALVGGLVNILLEDSQGFARRATICTLTEWLDVFPWLQTGLNCVSQDIKSCCDANGQASEAASWIRQGVSSAMFDLDWEVKLGALQFWETFINLYISRHGSLDTCTCWTKIDNDEEGDVISESCTSLFKLKQLLKQEELITKLGKVLDDEDRMVALKACQMLLSLQNHIQSHPLIQNNGSYLKSDESCLEEFIRKSLKELEKLSLEKILEVKMKVVDGYEEHPVSLLEDILAVTQQKDANILDCY